MEPKHERIARIALAAGAPYGLALASGYAVSAHGMGNRPSGDVDLFTSWELTTCGNSALSAGRVLIRKTERADRQVRHIQFT